MKAWKCDICGKFSTNSEEKGSVLISDYEEPGVFSNRYDVCPDCAERVRKMFKVEETDASE